MNLINLFKDQIGGVLVDQASSFLGEDKSKTTTALSAIVPSLLGGLVNKGSNEQGASGIMDMITKGGFNGDMLGNVAGLFSGGDSTNNLMSSGGNILSSLLGDKMGGIVNAISSFSGLGSGSSSSLMKMAAPLLMSVVGKQVMNGNMGVSGLMNLLSGQKEHIATAMPSGLGNMSSLLGFANGFKNNITDGVTKTVDTGAKVVKETTSTVRNTAAGAGAAAAGTAKKGMGFLKWLLPLLIVAALLFFGLRSCGGDVKDGGNALIDGAKDIGNTVTDGAKNIGNTVADGAKDIGNTVADGVKDGGNALVDGAKGVVDAISKVTLPGGKEISFAAGSFGDKVVNFLNGDKADYSKAFTFDGLNFATGSANLTTESDKQISNLSEILKAYPKFNVRIEGHTDNTGDAAKNKTLSSNRAKSVKEALIAKGISAGRIDTAGLGQTKPIADNNTEEGRLQNRRVEMYFVK